ncbi:MAG TPA: hypothetical protein VGR07_14710 [Thermoanaerobaculia bacterium]|nr:hypothetical protein [Thermoanaerobaculia bacterium]
MNGRVVSRLAVFLVLAWVAAGALAASNYKPVLEAEEAAKAARPRAISEAERAAVGLAADYIQGGPQVWWDWLAAGSPLRRLGRSAALSELAARVGPADGATWQLLTPGRVDPQRAVFGIEFASGLDETLELRLVEEGGFKLAEIRTTSDPLEPAAVLPGGTPGTADIPAAATTRAVGAPAGPRWPWWTAALALLLGAAGALALGRAGQKAAALALGAAAFVVLAGALVWGMVGRHAAAARAAAAAGLTPAAARLDLGALAPLRAALAAGADRAAIARLLAAVQGDPRLRDVQELWRAQYLMGEGDLRGAEAILRRFPESPAYPLADLLRARLAFRRMRRAETGWLYVKAIGHGLDDDGLRLEAGFAEAQTDEEDHAEVDFKRMVEMGSRLSEPWYVAAQLAASQDRIPEAEAYLRRAWQLEPAPRASLFGSPLLAALVARPSLFPLFKLGVPEEARLAPEGPRRPLALPAAARAATCGQALRLSLGNAVLLVPGGAELAPADAVLEDAATWSHHEETRALAALPALTAQSAAGGTLPPRLLRLAERAGSALSEQHRWTELVALTAAMAAPTAETASAPADLVRLRAKALHQLDRDGEARELLVRLAKSDIAGRRPATTTLFALAELFAEAGEYDTAIKLIEKADSQLPEPRGEQRRRQLAMDRDLAASYSSFLSDHFEVRYPSAKGDRYARQVAWVLEEERKRLQHWIPSAGSKRIEVHLFPIKDFYASFASDVAVVGLFDGKMRVPFGEQRTLHPKLVAILSHELAHALMTDATHGQTPHWVQEGVAQHIEMGTERFNPLPDLAETGHALSFANLDPILKGFAEKQLVGLAYSEAAWAIAFIEARFGERAIPRLLAAFAAGRTTDQAIAEVCGLTPAEFDRAFWAWGTGAGPRVRTLETRSYGEEYDELETREKLDDGLHLGRRPDEGDVRQKMSDWQARYAARTAGIKRRMKPIVELYEREGLPVRDGTAAACGELAAEVRKLLADPAVWSTPDRDIGDELRAAYGLIADLGDACQIGQDPRARELIKKIGVALRRSAERLSPYGGIP